MAGPGTTFGKRVRTEALSRALPVVESDAGIGKEVRNKKRSLWPDEKKNNWTILRSLCGAGYILIITMLVIGVIERVNRTPEELAEITRQDAARAVKAYAEDRSAVCRKDRKVEVFTFVQSTVTKALPLPSTASFNIAESDIKLVEDCLYKIWSFVDSQNGVGAIVRTPWTATVEYIPETDGWKLRKIDLNES